MDNAQPTASVLFVCLGNICRSPAADGVMQHVLRRRGISGVRVDSAGTNGFHNGERADARMRSVATARGYALTSRSRQVTKRDLETFDLVVAMDRQNLADLQELHESPTARLQLFMSFADGDGQQDVPDPYYGGADGFEHVLDLVERGCEAIADTLSS